MFKECKVLSYNKFLNILVFDYDGKQIQTTIKLDDNCKTVYVKYEDGICEFVKSLTAGKEVKGTCDYPVYIAKRHKA